MLRRRGARRVRPLVGGLDAWVAAGLPVEAYPAPEGAGQAANTDSPPLDPSGPAHGPG